MYDIAFSGLTRGRLLERSYPIRERKRTLEDLDLSVEISGFRIQNPLILASGILGVSIPLLRRVVEAGAGAVVTKSVGYKERAGYKNPTLVEVTGGYINAIGLSNPGIKEFCKEISHLKIGDLPLIVSLFSAQPEEIKEMVNMLECYEIKGYELNLSCPHVKGVGVEVGQDPKMLPLIVKGVKSETKRPVFVKLSPNVASIGNLAKLAEDAGADAITAVNTFRAMAIDTETFRPILSNKFGGLSGPSIKPIAVRCVYEIFENVKIPIVGCGGVSDWQDAVEFFLAGASAVQFGYRNCI